MKNIFKPIIHLSLIVPLIYLTGCATLDQSECEMANWEIIGFEDGASGKAASTVGQHRSACAEYTIAPDLSLYLKGHNRGVKEYCTYQNGFELGRRGRSLTNICSEVNSKEFNSAYHKGKQHYLITSKIQRVKSKIHSLQNGIKHISKEIEENEEIIILSRTSSAERRKLLESNKNLHNELELAEGDLYQQESILFELEDRYAKLAN